MDENKQPASTFDRLVEKIDQSVNAAVAQQLETLQFPKVIEAILELSNNYNILVSLFQRNKNFAETFQKQIEALNADNQALRGENGELRKKNGKLIREDVNRKLRSASRRREISAEKAAAFERKRPDDTEGGSCD